MRLYLAQIHSFSWVAIQYFTYEVDHLSTQIDWELDIDFQNLVIGLVLVSFALEWCSTSTEFIAENS